MVVGSAQESELTARQQQKERRDGGRDGLEVVVVSKLSGVSQAREQLIDCESEGGQGFSRKRMLGRREVAGAKEGTGVAQKREAKTAGRSVRRRWG